MRNPKTARAFFALVLLVLGCAEAAQAAPPPPPPITYVTANKGNDSNSCSRTQPCRTVTRGLAAVAQGGRVVILESGDYDQFSVSDKSVTVVAERGVHADITATTGLAAVELSGSGRTVTLRNLHLKFQSSSGLTSAGIRAVGPHLRVDDCIIEGFGFGILFSAPARLSVTDTTVRDSVTGMDILSPGGGPPALANVDHCLVEGLGFSGGGAAGIRANNARVTVSGTRVTGMNRGFYASDEAELTLTHCIASQNGIGVSVDGREGKDIRHVVRLASSVISGNDIGLEQAGAGQIYSLGNNLVHGNLTEVVGTVTPVPGS